jgi:hypothetical protein
VTGLDDRGIGVRSPRGAVHFLLLHKVQIGSGALPVPYPVVTGSSFPEEIQRARATDHHLVPRRRIRGDVPPLLLASSWRDVEIKQRESFNFSIIPVYLMEYQI